MTIEAYDYDGKRYLLGDQFQFDGKIFYITYLLINPDTTMQGIRTITQNLDEVEEFTTTPEHPLSRVIHLTGENKQITFINLRKELDNE